MKKVLFAVILVLTFAHVHADVKIPKNFPAQKCAGLEKELKSFANDLTAFARQENIPEVKAQEAFDFMLLEVGMAISEEPADCKYAVSFVKRKHKQLNEK